MFQVSIDVDRFRAGLVESGALTKRRFSIAINRAARRLANMAMTDFQSTVETWDTKVNFELVYKLRPSQDIEEFTIYHDNLIYKFVDEGTVAHKIPYKPPTPEFDDDGKVKLRKRLRFPSSFTPKTSFGELGSVAGGYGDTFVFASEVNHPGAKARNFSELILDKIVNNMDDIIYEELDAAYQRQWGRQ